MPGFTPQFGTGAIAPAFSFNPLEQLKSLGVDTGEIDTQVDTEIETQKATSFGKDEFFNDVNIIQSDNELDYDTAFDETLKYYKSKGYSIEGINIDAELGVKTPVIDDEIDLGPKTPQEKIEKPTTAIGAFTQGGRGKLEAFDNKLKEIEKNLAGSVVASVPRVFGNFLGFMTNIGGETLEAGVNIFRDKENQTDVGGQIGDAIIELGNKGEAKIQEALGVDPEAVTTSIGKFGTELGSLFIGGGSTLPNKIKTLVEKTPKLRTAITGILGLIEDSPKLQKALNITKSSLIGAKEAAAFGVVAEGEISPTGATIGLVANPALTLGGKIINKVVGKDAISGLWSVISPVRSKGVTAKQIKNDLISIAGTIKSRKLNPKNLEELYQGLSKTQKNIYEKGIKPRLQKVGADGASINMDNVIDDVFKDLSTVGKIAGVSKAKLTGKGGELSQLKKSMKAWKTGKTDILDVEKLKQLSSALVRESGAGVKDPILNSVQLEFFTKLNKSLQNQIEKKLTAAGGEGVLALKAEYGAIARQLPALDAKIIRELKKSGVSLFEGLGIISGVKDIFLGNVQAGTTSILTGKILNLLRDPDEILQRTIGKINKEGVKNTIGDKLVGAGAGIAGEKADTAQRKKIGLE